MGPDPKADIAVVHKCEFEFPLPTSKPALSDRTTKLLRYSKVTPGQGCRTGPSYSATAA